jgi:hypothetical protein
MVDEDFSLWCSPGFDDFDPLVGDESVELCRKSFAPFLADLHSFDRLVSGYDHATRPW